MSIFNPREMMDNLNYLLGATSLLASSLTLRASGSDWKSLEVRVPSPEPMASQSFPAPFPSNVGQSWELPSPHPLLRHSKRLNLLGGRDLQKPVDALATGTEVPGRPGFKQLRNFQRTADQKHNWNYWTEIDPCL